MTSVTNSSFTPFKDLVERKCTLSSRANPRRASFDKFDDFTYYKTNNEKFLQLILYSCKMHATAKVAAYPSVTNTKARLPLTVDVGVETSQWPSGAVNALVSTAKRLGIELNHTIEFGKVPNRLVHTFTDNRLKVKLDLATLDRP